MGSDGNGTAYIKSTNDGNYIIAANAISNIGGDKTQNSFGLTFFFNFNLRFRRNGTHKDKISLKQKKYVHF
jgi:hypothetical protein